MKKRRITMTFGQKLRTLREDRHLSQEALAKLLSTSKQVISRYERGERVPSLTTAIRYARLLDIPFAYWGED
jgi:transcriptional regulator with XRE-family HTH domain